MAIVFAVTTILLALYLGLQHMQHQTQILDLRRIMVAEQTRLNDLLATNATEYVHLKTQTDIALEQKDQTIGREMVTRQRYEDQVQQLTEGMKPSLWRYKKGKQSVWKYTDHEVLPEDAREVEAYTIVPKIQQELDLEISNVSPQ